MSKLMVGPQEMLVERIRKRRQWLRGEEAVPLTIRSLRQNPSLLSFPLSHSKYFIQSFCT